MNKFFILLVLSIQLFAVQALKVDSALNVLNDYEYQTPKGKSLRIPPKSTLILVAFEKATSDLVNNYLKTKNKYYLQQNNAIFIADVSKTPRVIRNMFVLPKLEKLKHLIYVQYSKELRHRVPNKDNKITLLRIEDGKIVDISYASSMNEIKIESQAK